PGRRQQHRAGTRPQSPRRDPDRAAEELITPPVRPERGRPLRPRSAVGGGDRPNRPVDDRAYLHPYNDKGRHRWRPLSLISQVFMVEVAGIEPASEGTPSPVLHA